MGDVPDDVPQWRKQRRAQLLAAREAVDAATLEHWRVAIDRHLEQGFPGLARMTVGLYWPHRGEYDARHLAARWREHGARTALPVVNKAREPLIFREWHPGVKMQSGVLGIPFPVESAEVRPAALLMPPVGFDGAGYRLGYGGGFFDRTLAAANPRPVAIGVAYELGRLPTIYPQPYDMPMDYVVTERGVYRRDGERLVFLGAPSDGEPADRASPVCYAGEAERPEFKS